MEQENNQERPITVSYTWTSQLFRQFSLAMYKTSTKLMHWLAIVLFLFVGILEIGHSYLLSVIGFVAAILIYLFCIRLIGINSYYKRYRLIKGVTYTIKLYDDHLEASDKRGSLSIFYEDLYDIKRSKYGYILMLGAVQGIFIPKKYCSEPILEIIHNIQNEFLSK